MKNELLTITAKVDVRAILPEHPLASSVSNEGTGLAQFGARDRNNVSEEDQTAGRNQTGLPGRGAPAASRAPPAHPLVVFPADADPPLTAREAAKASGLSLSAFWRAVADGRLPSPVYPLPRATTLVRERVARRNACYSRAACRAKSEAHRCKKRCRVMASIEISAVVIGIRHRRELGDIAVLAKSIQEVGLLHPIVVDSEKRLIAGRRRLEAAKMLGWKEIPARTVDLAEIVRGEFAENAIRKDFLPSEIEAIRRALQPAEKSAAKERMREGATKARAAKLTICSRQSTAGSLRASTRLT